MGLGEPEEEEEDLLDWVRRWNLEGCVVKSRAPNTEVLRQLREYFAGMRKEFKLNLHMLGTPFQMQVWQELLQIPYGETRSYSEIAMRIGNPQAQRAVGLANNKNPLAIVVPCHRVIGKSGNLTGYAGGVYLKDRLLVLEKNP